MMQPIISIIMTVYNAEATVGRMIESILAQTFSEWELIAVDDGSTDDSSIILDSYAEKESRIRVIHKKNGGVASARQAGMDAACGIYTIHADSDDWVEPNMLSEMYRSAVDRGAEIVIADYFVNRAGTAQKVIKQMPESLDPIEILYALYAKDLFGGLCHKLIKKSVYDKARAQFISGIDYCEDLLILTKILMFASPKIAYLPSAYYHYVLNQNSITQKVSLNGLKAMRRFHKEAVKILPQGDRFADVKKKFRINEFLVIFTNRLYGNSLELKREYVSIHKIISNIPYGIRWKAGFWCINHSFLWMAHKLIRLS